MRIIDKNKDFYDFYQNVYHDNTFTFDRRNSYDLSKEEFSDMLQYTGRYELNENERHILLQVCSTFWLFKLTFIDKKFNLYCRDYNLRLLATWTNRDVKRELIKLSQIIFTYPYHLYHKNLNALDYKNFIRTNEYKEYRVFNKFTLSKDGYMSEKRTIPILKNIGVAAFIEPLDIYLALEEFFARQKQDEERTESINLTNDEKITNHGFDLKSSFRGK